MFGQLSNAQARRPAPGGGHRHRHGHGGNGGGPSFLQKWYRGTDSIATSRPPLVWLKQTIFTVRKKAVADRQSVKHFFLCQKRSVSQHNVAKRRNRRKSQHVTAYELILCVNIHVPAHLVLCGVSDGSSQPEQIDTTCR